MAVVEVTGLKGAKRHKVQLSDYAIDWDHVVSRPQKRVKDFLRPFWQRPGKVITEEFRIPGSLLRVDLMDWTKRVAVEVSPKGSHSFNPFFHRGSRAVFGAAMKNELLKGEWFPRNGFTLVEIFDEDFDRLSAAWFAEQGVKL